MVRAYPWIAPATHRALSERPHHHQNGTTMPLALERPLLPNEPIDFARAV